jgi:hypothetical protein
MSRAHEAGHSAVTVPGDVALPLPSGDVAGLRSAARSLDRAASRARATTTVSGTLGRRLGAVWSGEAASAARAEADELGCRARRVVDALPQASRSLMTYAAALEHAIARVRSLQRQWDALDDEHLLAVLRVAGIPDPTGAMGTLGVERARSEQRAGRARLSRSYAGVMDELRATARRCSGLVAAVTDTTVPADTLTSAAAVREVVTGGLWFADGAVAARASREAAVADGVLARRLLAGVDPVDGAVGGPGAAGAGETVQLTNRVMARVDDPVYAQALLSELGAGGLSELLVAAGVTRSVSGAPVDGVRGLLGALGSLLVTATSHSAPAGTDPRTRAQLASGAALLADELVAGVDTVHVDPRGGGRASGAWLLGQLLAGARAAGDDRSLPARLARRAAAAAATSEIAETRDADARLEHGSTLLPDGVSSFTSWFDDAAETGDALHVLLGHVGDDPADAAALLAEPLPLSAAGGDALLNSRGDRLTLGEHLVRRWITHEASGTESHSDLCLRTDADLMRQADVAASSRGDGAAQTRARLMLEVSRTSDFAMSEASTTRIYTGTTAPLEDLVVGWMAAMRENIDLALVTHAHLADPGTPYAAPTSGGPQPWLTPQELTGVVGALAVDTGMGLDGKYTGPAYDRLVDSELDAARQTVASGGDVRHGVARLGFFDQSASATLVALARRQDEINRSALNSVAEAAHVLLEIRRGNVTALLTAAHSYRDGGTQRTPQDELVISLVRSNVELAQTEVDDARRADLVTRIEAITGSRNDVLPAMSVGARRAPALPTAEALRAARSAEIRAAANAAVKDGAAGIGSSVEERLKQRAAPHDRVHVVDGPASSPRPHAVTGGAGHEDVRKVLSDLPAGRQKQVRLVRSEAELDALLRALTATAERICVPASYAGPLWQRNDGVRIGRRTSVRFGASVDIWFPDGSYRKVHIDAVAQP